MKAWYQKSTDLGDAFVGFHQNVSQASPAEITESLLISSLIAASTQLF